MNAFTLRLLSVFVLAAATSAPAAPTFTQTAGGPETSAGQIYRRASDGALYSLLSDRLYKSTDNGSTWTLVAGYPASIARGLDFSGTDLYASGVFGVAISTTDGASWSSFNGTGNGALPIASANQVLVAGGFVYAYGSDGSFQSHLYRSATGTASWSEVTPPMAAANGINNMAAVGTNICVSVSNNGVKYSANHGDSWSSASGANGSLPLLAVSAANANTVFAGSTGGGVSRSTNSCQSFSQFGTPGIPQSTTISSLGTDISGTLYVGVNDGTVRQANATGSAYTTINGGTLPTATGVAITSLLPVTGGLLAGTTGLGLNFGDGTTTWVRRGSGLKGGAINALEDRGTASQFAASSGGVLFTANGGDTYTEQNSGMNLRATGSVVRIGANYLVAAFQANKGQGTAAPGLFRSADSGATWAQLQTSSGLPADANVDQLITDGTNFYAALSFSKGLYKSTDGATWSATANTGLPANPGFRNLAVRGTKLWAYVANNGVYRSLDGGANWENVTHELSGDFFGKVFATAHSLIASAGGVVYRSLNDGDSWSATTGFAISKFGIEILSLAEDSAQALYLGDEHAGLSVSKDGGATWTPSSDGLATSAVCIERIQALLSKDGKIYAAQGEGGGVRSATAIGNGTAGDSIGCTTSVDTYPNNFSFTAQNNVAPGTEIHSNVITIAGLGSGVSTNIRVVGGAYSLSSTAAGASSNCTGPFVTTNGQVQNGSLVCVSQTSSSASETAKTTQLFVGDAATLGEVSALFSTATGLVFTGRTDEINTSYGSNGFAHVANLNQAADVKVLGDGSVILATQTNSFPSDLALVKFKPDGTPDTAFGTGGKATISIGGSANTIAVIVLPSGKLLAVANTNISGVNKIAIARFTSSGQPDTFGTNGVLLYDTAVSTTEGAASAVALAGDAFMIGGHLTVSGSGSHLFAAKFAADGTPDSSFGSSGLATIQVGSSSATGGALAIQADGKIVAVGQADTGFNTFSGVAVRFTATGGADATFGTSGKFVVSGAFSLLDVALLPGGNIMAVGQSGNPFMPVVVRLTSAGALDGTYANGGLLSIALTGNSTSGGLAKILVLASGSIAVTGSAFQSDISSNVLLFAILKSDGTLDSVFGGGHGYVVRRPVNGSAVLGPSLQQRSDGGVVIGGMFGNDTAAFVYGGQAGAPPDDTTPGPYDFTDQQNVEPLATVTSNTVTITDINKPATIHVTGGQYSVGGPLDCGSTFVSSDGTVSLGQKVCLQHTAAMAFGGMQTTTVTIGGVSDTFTSTVRAGDAVPNDFAFVNKTDVAASTVITSAPVVVNGFEVSLPVTVAGGTFAIIASDATACGNTFGTSGNISSGQKVCARHTSSANPGGVTETTVTIGGKSATFRSTTFAPPPPDTTPNAFHFNDVTGVALSTVVVSNTVTIDGIDAPASVTVENGEYSIGAGDCNGQSQFHSEAGSITNGQKVCVRHTSAATPGTAVNTTLHVGGTVMDVYTSTTLSAGEIDTTPDAYTLTDADGVEPDTVTTSAPVTISGINSLTPISIEGGSYSIGDGAFTSAAGQVTNGQLVRVRVTSSPNFAAAVNASLIVGGVMDTYTATTRAANQDSVPDPAGHPVGFTAPVGVTISNLTNSATKPDGAPTGLFYPNGFFSFDINGVTVGGTAVVQVVLPAGTRPTGYLKCDGTHCERFAGATISGNTITLTLVDGGAGDSDHTANGVISDPGAPIADTPATGSGGGALNPSLLLGLGLLGLRRRRSRS